MTILLVSREVWEGTDRFGNLLLSQEARQAITHNGKLEVEFKQEPKEAKK